MRRAGIPPSIIVKRASVTLFEYLFLAALSLIVLTPLVYAIFGSLKTTMEFLTAGPRILPRKLYLGNYVEAFTRFNFLRYTLNSLFVAGLTVSGRLVICFFAGYAFVRFDFPGKKVFLGIVLASMLITANTSITVYPILRIAHFLRLDRDLAGLTVVYWCTGLGNYVFLVMGYLRGIPKELDEAATLDGLNPIQTAARIILPVSKPIILTIALLNFQFAWNDYLLPLVFTMHSEKMRTLIIGVLALRDTGDGASDWALMLSGVTIALVPVIALYIVANRYFVTGITGGALKG